MTAPSSATFAGFRLGTATLNPVKFQYKNDKTNTPQFGLIAEDVAKVNPDLVVRDKNGEIYSVRYDQVNAMLLNEFLKEHKAFVEEQRTVQRLEGIVERLVATVKKQAVQIQTVSTRGREQIGVASGSG